MVSTQPEKAAVQGEEKKRTEAVIMEKDAVVSGKSDVNALSSRGYGTVEKGKLRLSPYETLFLMDKGFVEVKQKKPKKKLGFEEVLQRFKSSDEYAWVKYLIYRDLRSRGYVVRDGFGLGVDFRLYERGEYGKGVAEYIVYSIQEGKAVAMKELTSTLKYAQSSKKRLILAVLNRRGEVVYYSLSQLMMK